MNAKLVFYFALLFFVEIYSYNDNDLNILNATGSCTSSSDPSSLGCDLRGIDSSQITVTSIKSLAGAHLDGATLSGMNLSGVDFTNADLSSAVMNDVNLDKAILTGATLGGTDLSTTNPWYQGGLSSAQNANFNDAGLGDCNLTNVNLASSTFNQVTFGSAILTGANFAQATLSNVVEGMTYELPSGLEQEVIMDLTTAQGFTLAYFTQTSLQAVNLSGMNLSSWNCLGCDLSSANLENITINGAVNFEHSIFKKASFNGAVIKGLGNQSVNDEVNFMGADFTGATLENITLDNASLNGAVFYDTIFTSLAVNNCDFTGINYGGNTVFAINTLSNSTWFNNGGVPTSMGSFAIIGTVQNVTSVAQFRSTVPAYFNYSSLTPIIPNGEGLCILLSSVNLDTYCNRLSWLGL